MVKTVLEYIYFLSAIPITIGVWIAAISLRAQRRSFDTQRFYYLHDFLSKESFMDARRSMRNYVLENPGWDQIKDWEPGIRKSADIVCASYDQAGILIESGFLSADDEVKFYKSSWGQSILEQFSWVGPYLDEPTAKRREFFRHFVRLADKVKAVRSIG